MKNETKKFYTLKELLPFTLLGYDALLYRVKKIENKYNGRTELLIKRNNKWYIHDSIINEFQKEKFWIDYKLFITIASSDNLNKAYWKFLLFQINRNMRKIDKTTRTKYVIELTKNNLYHLHFITTFDNENKLNELLKGDILINNMNIDIQDIYEKKNLHKYLRKRDKPILLNTNK